MILTEEIKDEIKLLVVETMKEVELGKNTPSADYPDFESWKNNLIELDCGLKFAPEDFYVGNRKFFTWDEAMEYEEKVLKPNGFRLPTLVEWTMAFCECGQGEDGSDDPDKLEEKLKLKKNGYIPDYEMDDYKKDPSSASEYNQGRAATSGRLRLVPLITRTICTTIPAPSTPRITTIRATDLVSVV